MQRNKFLDKLGINPREYGINFDAYDSKTDKSKKRYKKRCKKYAKQRKLYGFDSRECYNLDRIFVEWLYSHLKMYYKDAHTIIDLKACKVQHQDKEYSLDEAIDYMLVRLECYLLNYDTAELKSIDKVREAILMWADAFPYMWW